VAEQPVEGDLRSRRVLTGVPSSAGLAYSSATRPFTSGREGVGVNVDVGVGGMLPGFAGCQSALSSSPTVLL
jgi:hypothetical protein